MQLTQVMLHFYTYFPVLLFKTANIYISVITKSSAKGDISGEEIFIRGWIPHHFLAKLFFVPSKTFSRNKTPRQTHLVQIKTFSRNQTTMQAHSVQPKTFSRYKMNHGKWIQKMNNQSKLISGKDSNRSQPKSGNDNVVWSTNNWPWDRYLFSEFA